MISLSMGKNKRSLKPPPSCDAVIWVKNHYKLCRQVDDCSHLTSCQCETVKLKPMIRFINMKGWLKKVESINNVPILPSWWLNQPILKNISPKWESFPPNSGEIRPDIWVPPASYRNNPPWWGWYFISALDYRPSCGSFLSWLRGMGNH